MFARPPFDPECAAVLAELRSVLPPTITPDMIQTVRTTRAPLLAQLEADLRADAGSDYRLEDRRIPGPPGQPELLVSVLRPGGPTTSGLGVCFLHGGGMFLGNRFQGASQLVDWVTSVGAVVVTVEYRLAPEHPHPAPVEDCYAGLHWTAEHADELGIDPKRLVVAGASAGGGLAAGTALLARDRGGPALAGQLLIYPMLDDRNNTASANQFEGIGVWDRGSNQTGWTALLGEQRGSDSVSPYAAPARATDLSGLPPTFIDVASTETFRDECVGYASALWLAGVPAELHVWPGGFHGFDLFAPSARISGQAREARIAWLNRLLG
ncbi:MAG TPA: alpha/beta hydrolase [Pseudonocardia sp.]|jgi:acetyl esterase/lipase